MKSRAIVLLLVSSAFASSTPAIPRSVVTRAVAPDQALICFYRGIDQGSKREHYSVRVHDVYVGRLARESFLYHLTAPGRRIVFVEAEVNVSRSFEIRAGEVHYIRVDRGARTFPARPKLLRVERTTGVRDLNQLSYSGHPLRGNAMQYCLQADAF